MGKIRIAFLSHGLSTNGIETFLVNVFRYLDRERYDITVLIGIDEGVVSAREQEVRDLGVRIIPLCDMDGWKKKAGYLKLLSRRLKEGQYDIVHANMDLLNGAALFFARRAGIPKRICHAHNSGSVFDTAGYAGKLMTAMQKIYSALMKKMIDRCSTVKLACSDLAAAYFYGKKAKDAQIIYNGIDLECFMHPSRAGSPDESMRMLDTGKTRFTAVGRLSVQKNPFFVLDTVRELSLLHGNVVCCWAGEGELKQELSGRIKAASMEEVFFLLGRRSDVPDILARSDCFLMPSLFEGLPFSLVEAQAAGLDCFVSDTVTKMADAGKCMYLPLDIGPRGWAQSIDAYLRSGIKMQIDGEKLKRFDIRNTAAALDSIYSG